jgi:hypothetical protein
MGDNYRVDLDGIEGVAYSPNLAGSENYGIDLDQLNVF